MTYSYPTGEEVKAGDIIYMDDRRTIRRVLEIGKYEGIVDPHIHNKDGIYCSADILGHDNTAMIHYAFDAFEREEVEPIEGSVLVLIKKYLEKLSIQLNVNLLSGTYGCAPFIYGIEDSKENFVDKNDHYYLNIYNKKDKENAFYLWDTRLNKFRKLSFEKFLEMRI